MIAAVDKTLSLEAGILYKTQSFVLERLSDKLINPSSYCKDSSIESTAGDSVF